MRAVLHAVARLVIIAAGIAITIPLAAIAAPEPPVVSQDDVLTRPYELTLDPSGEFKVLHFDAGLVSSVLVAHPYLLTVVIQGSDVILQAKASTGRTQVLVYIGDAGTLWQVTIAPHGPAPTKIVVRAPGEPTREPRTPPRSESAPGPQVDPRLAAFLQQLGPDQQRGFAAWRRDPRAERLAEWLAGLTPEQRAAFDSLVQAGAVRIRSPLAGPPPPEAPPLVDTTTTVVPTPRPAASSPAASSPGEQRAVPDAVSVVAVHVPDGVALEASASRDGDIVRVTYTVRNSRAGALAHEHVTATDGHGHDSLVTWMRHAEPVASLGEASGAFSVRAGAFPVIITWTWSRDGVPVVVTAAVLP